MPQTGVPIGLHACVSLVVPRFLWRDRELSAAKTIFHVSGWQARHWPPAVAFGGWSYRDRWRGSLPFGTI